MALPKVGDLSNFETFFTNFNHNHPANQTRVYRMTHYALKFVVRSIYMHGGKVDIFKFFSSSNRHNVAPNRAKTAKNLMRYNVNGPKR